MKLPRGKKPRIALAAGAAVACGLALFASCGGCGRSGTGNGPSAAGGPAASGSASVSERAAGVDARPVRDPQMWAAAKDGEVEDLATLAVHEGAAGLVEAASDADLRPTAIRAMAHARGWAQLPYLSGVASGKDDAEAKLALDSILDLAARPRRSEDPEDASELADGCEKLVGLARAADGERARRIAAIRALRMMPCPKADLPTDLDAR